MVRSSRRGRSEGTRRTGYVEAPEKPSHAATLVLRLVRAPRARRAFDERRDADGVARAEAADRRPFIVGERCEHELEPSDVAQRRRGPVRTLEGRERRVHATAGLESRREIVDGDERARIVGVGSPVMASEADGQVLEAADRTVPSAEARARGRRDQGRTAASACVNRADRGRLRGSRAAIATWSRPATTDEPSPPGEGRLPCRQFPAVPETTGLRRPESSGAPVENDGGRREGESGSPSEEDFEADSGPAAMRAFALDAFDTKPRLCDDLSEPRPVPATHAHGKLGITVS